MKRKLMLTSVDKLIEEKFRQLLAQSVLSLKITSHCNLSSSCKPVLP